MRGGVRGRAIQGILPRLLQQADLGAERPDGLHLREEVFGMRRFGGGGRVGAFGLLGRTRLRGFVLVELLLNHSALVAACTGQVLMGIIELVLIESELGVDQIQVFLQGVFGAGGRLGDLRSELRDAGSLGADPRFQIHQTLIQFASFSGFGRRIFLGVFEGRGKSEVDGVVGEAQSFLGVLLLPVGDRQRSQLLGGFERAGIDELFFMFVANRVHVEPARRIGPIVRVDGRGQRRNQQDQESGEDDFLEGFHWNPPKQQL